MKKMLDYLIFIEENGRPLSEINPGSNERALKPDAALQALKLLKNNGIVILGGDILSEKDNRLIYAYQLWGSKYIYLNWYCDKIGDEDEASYLKRSYDTAVESIINANKIAQQFNDECYIVLVIQV